MNIVNKKIGLAATLGLLATPIFAYQNNITDLQYMPKQGNFRVQSEILLEGQDSETRRSSNNSRVSENKISKTNTVFSFGYSILESLEIGATLGAQVSGSNDNTTVLSGVTTENSESGLMDPELNVRYRVFNENDKIFTLDIVGSLSPSIGDREIANTTNGGNALRGGNSGSVGVQFAQTFERHQYNVTLEIGQDLTRTNQLAGIDSEYSEDSGRTNILLSTALQFSLSETLNLEAFGGFQQTGSYDSTVLATNNVTNNGSLSELFAGVGANYIIIPGKLAVGGNLQYSVISDQDVTTSTNSFTVEYGGNINTAANLIFQF